MILLIDNYDSFTYNLAQYLGTFADVKVLRNDAENLYQEAQTAAALVFSPGPGWPADAGNIEKLIKDFAGEKPILGICLGHQAIAESFGGRLGLAKNVRHGKQSPIELQAPFLLFEGIPDGVPIMRYHSIVVEEVPYDFEVTAIASDDHEIMAIQHKELPIYGLQYHPESIGSPNGLKMIKNFVKLSYKD
ncbi:aminodeoxychorismate/anthranilate synthase component II [Streptococcus troglodytae]|uniref:Anthranilate synthase component II n=1 Tax=Streptococcus troglodytae TaxID=1111760 RepID=A0A1L7LM36_9STRE|nr:aminodeoxychorismate/anthranilate synthase component II [Streptococcus troglodytae]BAQ25092.1 anthranilate synthase component II [Streptococcus troglodytae]